MGKISNEQKLTNLFFEQTSDAIFFVDANQEIINKNKAAERLLAEHHVKIQDFIDFCVICKGYTSINDEKTCHDCFIKRRERGEAFQIFVKHKEKGEIPYSASFTLMDAEQGIGVLSLRNLTEQQETAELLQKKTLTKYVMNAHEAERKKLSRELHDGLAQEMYSALMEVRKLKYMEKGLTFNEQMEGIESFISTILDDIRNMAVELRPSALDDLGLFSALKSYCKRYEQIFGVQVALISNVHHERFSSAIETMLYRVAQESLTNAAKYADVDEIIVTLRKRDNTLLLEIIDEGCGFSTEDIEIKGTGLGLMNMQERVELLGGKCTIHSEIGNGTQISVLIPIS
ncbi:sensor histidine kinase [Listeria sp. PSOL-1]|uniref:sensor histidine kinase n=1 Tax=Listeria sp. PSOL-1 TaxID=1844999 RepID=UPI0013D02580|nr:sensor histidine kinase [Listeria sp. PSOL-1]